MKFRNFFYKIIHKEIRRKLFFSNSKVSSVKVGDSINNYTKKDFFELSNLVLRPFLIENGFKGKNQIYIKESLRSYNRIVIASSKHGNVFCVNCEIKEKTTNKYDVLKFESFPTNFDYWKRLSPDKNDCWWFTANTKEKNIEILKEMIQLIEFEGFSFFNKNNKKLQ